MKVVCFNEIEDGTRSRKILLCGHVLLTGITEYRGIDVICPRCGANGKKADGVSDNWDGSGDSIVAFQHAPLN